MNTKAFTILEMLIATTIAMVLMLGSVKVLENMARQSWDFKTRIDRDMNWVVANRHLAEHVHRSSYLEMSGTDLVLHDSNDNPTGKYVNVPSTVPAHPENGRLEYQTKDAAGPGYTLQDTFNNVNATFALKAGALTAGGQNIEAIITYAQPFASLLYLRCPSVKSSSTWAIIIGVKNNDCEGFVISPILDKSNGQVTGYMAGGELRGGLLLYKMDLAGNQIPLGASTSAATWFGGNTVVSTSGVAHGVGTTVGYSLMGGPYGQTGVGYPRSIKQTFDSQAGGSSTGFIIGGVVYKENNAPFDINDDSYILKVKDDGSYQWARNCGIAGYRDVYVGSANAYQIFNSGNPDGYVLFSSYQTLQASFLQKYLFYRINEDGSLRRKRLIGPLNSLDICNGGTPILDKNNNLTGYLLAGKIKPNDPSDIDPYHNGLYIAQIRENVTAPNIVYDSTVTRTLYNQKVTEGNGYLSVRQVFDASHNPSGFIMMGHEYEYVSPTYYDYYAGFLKLRTDGSVEWSKEITIPGAAIFWGTSVQQTFDNLHGGNPTGYILGMFTSTFSLNASAIIAQTTAQGARQWNKPYSGWWIYSNPYVIQVFNSAGAPDGYIIIGSSAAFKSTLNNLGCGGRFGTGIYIIKTDVNGDCSEAANPTPVALDFPTAQVFNCLSVDTISLASPNEDVDDTGHNIDYTVPTKENL